ncbi:MBL fold metallo-hydrolase [Bacillus sp. es.034]|uniref:MBL fold metallo-hydrolase n=1 Tax=Bacillus sp. es.034 TaxID=1761763 RepID=UPI000BF45A50|nr:MBL fold metallo-hydrolase [Bacillus sp. es.034]PFG06909.1 glyoxylase-like metal-dependent hydrolase (beta-lactamase superfamily II) [Bacillus sp. es.034]
MSIYRIDSRISLVDLMDLSLNERTGSYIINEETLTIIETSASPSIPHLKKGLSKLNINLEDIQYIILTHIHLDHAGGAGLFLKECPNARIIVHPKGRRHLIDPTRLISGARAVYGEKFDELFDPIVPIPEERILVMEHEEKLSLSDTCTLTFYHTPGHANHHLSIFDSASNGMFTGDTCGIQYTIGSKRFYFPSTSPNQFDPEKMKSSIHLYRSLHLDRLYFGHYGVSEEVSLALSEVEKWLDLFMKKSEEQYSSHVTMEENVRTITSALIDLTGRELVQKGIDPKNPIFSLLELDMNVSAMGIVDYFIKQKGDRSS